MLGRLIYTSRKERSLTGEELAASAGIPAELLRDIEEGAVIPPIDPKIVLRIADQFKFRQSQDFIYFMKCNRARKFKTYVVGLPKTGTRSLTGIFGDYCAGHEFNQLDTQQMIIRHTDNLVSYAEYRDFVMKRDAMSRFLELDSAHFNRHYMDILAEVYPESKFIFLIRDCFSWVESYINYFTIPDREAIQAKPEYNGLPFDLPKGDNEAKKELIRNFDKYIDAPLSHWTTENLKMIENCRRLPDNRYLIIRTNEISDRIDKIAGLVGVEADTLIRDHSHLHKASYHVNILKRLDPQFLEEKFDTHCSYLMNEFFPGYTLKDFLAKQKQ
jgi:transcriptional regulator with XRE-family HTH domain